nr:DNA-directed RNA polymerase subunit omega [Microvirga sp. Mcv34]
MARITTVDCERVVPNRFELVLLASYRAHELWNGAEPQVSVPGEKPTVLALREIAAERIDPGSLRQQLVNRFMQADIDPIEFHKQSIPKLAPASPSGGTPDEPLEGGAPAPVHCQ